MLLSFLPPRGELPRGELPRGLADRPGLPLRPRGVPEPTRARELRQQELAESVRAARPATPRDESRVLQPTTASASRLIDPEQKFEVKPKQRGRPDAALNPGRRAIPAWRAPLHK